MPKCRLLYPCELAVDLLQPLFGCLLFHHLYPAAPGASALHSVAAVVAGNGVAALFCLTKCSPLTFR